MTRNWDEPPYEGEYTYWDEAPYLDDLPEASETLSGPDPAILQEPQATNDLAASDEVEAAVRSALAALRQVINNIGGSHRHGQQEMCDAVARGAARRRHVIAHAPTGIGKSLSYLVPAIAREKPVVVASATKALQDQLLKQDIPKVRTHLEVNASTLKGRGNYVCVQKLKERRLIGFQERLDNQDQDLFHQIERIEHWAAHTDTGDRDELDFEPMYKAWSSVSTAPQECPGRRECPSGDPSECFAERAIDRAHSADVVIANISLYLLGALGVVPGIPDHDLAIIDEAHELERIASEMLGVRLSRPRAIWVLNQLEDFGVEATACKRSFELLFESLAEEPLNRSLLPLPDHLKAALASALFPTRELLRTIARMAESLEWENPPRGSQAWSRLNRAKRLTRLISALLEDIHRFENATYDNDEVWTELANDTLTWRLAPIDVSKLLDELIWSKRTAVLSSATIPRNFEAALGFQNQPYYEISPDSPFDYSTNTLLYVPPDIPNPNEDEHREAVNDTLEKLIRAADGRTLALFTSWRALDASVESLRNRVPQPVLRQGDSPPAELLRRFVGDPRTCLFATRTFWEGVDIPGDTLSLLVIDRLPFPPPVDPLINARKRRHEPNGFRRVVLPIMLTRLGQGVGRLMRSETDQGVVAVLDPRLGDSPYSSEARRALPPFPFTRDEDRVVSFLRQIAAGS